MQLRSMLNDIKISIGISLVAVGVNLGMYFNYFFPFVEWSPIFMGLSILFLTDYRNIAALKFPSFNKVLLFLILYQAITLIFATTIENYDFIEFHIYCIFLSITISTINYINIKTVLMVLLLISGICSVLGAYFIMIGFVGTDAAWEMKQNNERFSIEAFTLSVGSLINFIICLAFISKKKFLKYLSLIFILLDVYAIVFAGKRTPLIVLFCVTIFYFYLIKRKDSTINFVSIIKITIISIFIFTGFYFFIELFRVKFDAIVDNAIKGIYILFGDQSFEDSTGSSSYRVEMRTWTYKYIETEFNFLNYFFGAGYMTRWIDNPLLQSYLDFGVFGFVSYLYLVIIYPIAQIIKMKIKNNLVLIFLGLCFYAILSVFNSGNPYQYIKFTPIILLAFSIKVKTMYS